MTSVEPTEIKSPLWQRARRTAIEYMAVYIASVSFVFTMLSMLLASVALFIAYQANEELELLEVRYVNLQAEVQGCER